MPDERITFIQDSANSFSLSENRIIIVRSNGIGLRDERVINIDDIRPIVEVTHRRIMSLYMIPIIFIATIVSLAFWLSLKNSVSVGVGISLGLFSMAFVIPLIDGLRPLETRAFRNRDGKFLFEIYRPRKSWLAYDEFVAVLTKRLGRENQ